MMGAVKPLTSACERAPSLPPHPTGTRGSGGMDSSGPMVVCWENKTAAFDFRPRVVSERNRRSMCKRGLGADLEGVVQTH